MYPPGWYPDPTTGEAWRWWDGGRWTERTAPFGVPKRTRSGLPTVSQWFDETLRSLRTVARSLWWRLALVWLVVAVPVGAVVVAAATSENGRVVRDALGLDGGLLFTGPSRREIADPDLDRAGDAFGDLMVDVAPWAAATVVLVFAASCWTYGAVAAVVRRHGPVGGSEAARMGIRRIPAVAAAWVVLYVLLLVTAALLAAPAVLARAAGADAVSVVILAFFGALAASVVLPLLGGRFALAPALASLGAHGIGITASWTATAGRFWPVVGRLLLAGALAGAVVGAAGSVLGVVQFLDLVAYLVVIVTFQAVAALVQTAVLVPGQVVLVEQLADLDRMSDPESPTTGAVTAAM